MNLPKNTTFSIRSVNLSPIESNRGYYIMQVEERRSKTSKLYTRRYLVHDLGMAPDKLGRHFRVRKSRDALNKEQEDFYNVLLSAFGPTKHSCDCKGWVANQVCVHVESLVALGVASFTMMTPRGGGVGGGGGGRSWWP